MSSKLGLFIVILLLTGCAESSFELSEDSRLPVWFELPEGKTRKDVKVTLTYYVLPGGREAILKMETKGKIFPEKIKGIQRGLHPIKIEASPFSYEVITAEGLTDVIEHRIKGPVFHIPDDPNIFQQLNVSNKYAS